MIIRYGCFETNSSSTHALCIGKGTTLKTPLELISKYRQSSYYDLDQDFIEKEDKYIRTPSEKRINKDRFYNKSIIYLKRFKNVGRTFDIFESFESKLNFIWTCLLKDYKQYEDDPEYLDEKGLNIFQMTNEFLRQLNKYGFEVRFSDIIMKDKEIEYKSWDKPMSLGKLSNEEYIPSFARGKYMTGLYCVGYAPMEELNIIINNELLLWNLLLGNSKIYTGSDEFDTFEDLNFKNYNYVLVGGSDSNNCVPENIFEYENNNKLISKYKNGTYNVEIYEDGTRIRKLFPENIFYDQKSIFKEQKFKVSEIDFMEPDFPESIDLKITNYCKNNCKYCYAKSNEFGKHADKKFVKKIISEMHPFTEVALGGGNAIEHPDLVEILEFAKSKNVICNITLKDIDVIEKIDLINELYDRNLIRSIGVSPSNEITLENAANLLERRDFIVHLILGIHNTRFLEKIKNIWQINKILFLGYKNIGFGKDYYKENEEKIDKNIKQIKDLTFFSFPCRIISFDNLAIKQLDIDTINLYNKEFQGIDGKFSYYIDAVEEKYAKSSLEENMHSFWSTVDDHFHDLKEEIKKKG